MNLLKRNNYFDDGKFCIWGNFTTPYIATFVGKRWKIFIYNKYIKCPVCASESRVHVRLKMSLSNETGIDQTRPNDRFKPSKRNFFLIHTMHSTFLSVRHKYFWSSWSYYLQLLLSRTCLPYHYYSFAWPKAISVMWMGIVVQTNQSEIYKRRFVSI